MLILFILSKSPGLSIQLEFLFKGLYPLFDLFFLFWIGNAFFAPHLKAEEFHGFPVVLTIDVHDLLSF